MSELYPVNVHYGIGNVLRTYSGFSGPIPAVVQYGVVFDPVLFPGEVEAPVPAVITWPGRDAAWEALGTKRVIEGCAPFLYALADTPEFQTRSGTLYMPSHSANLIDNTADWRGLARWLKREDPDAIVCLHIEDARRGRHVYFEKQGFRVVCNGTHEDQHFLYKLAVLLRRCERMLTNGPSSHPLYAVAAGVPTVTVTDADGPAPRYIGPDVVWERDGRELFGITPEGYTQAERDGLHSIGAMFASCDPVTDAQREFVSGLLGTYRMPSRETLKEQLESAAGE